MTPSVAFPLTRVSLVEALASHDDAARDRAADRLARAYWAPVVATLCRRWRLERADAEDVAQDFFARALHDGWLARWDPGRARFRTFLRRCVDRFAANAAQAEGRLKRGGAHRLLSLDETHAALPAADSDAEVDALFHREWVRGVFTMALEALRAEAEGAGKGDHVALFVAYDVDDAPDGARPSYRDLAARFGVPETTVTNRLAWARRAFRRHVLDTLRALAGSEAEFREDARALLGVTVP